MMNQIKHFLSFLLGCGYVGSIWLILILFSLPNTNLEKILIVIPIFFIGYTTIGGIVGIMIFLSDNWKK